MKKINESIYLKVIRGLHLPIIRDLLNPNIEILLIDDLYDILILNLCQRIDENLTTQNNTMNTIDIENAVQKLESKLYHCFYMKILDSEIKLLVINKTYNDIFVILRNILGNSEIVY